MNLLMAGMLPQLVGRPRRLMQINEAYSPRNCHGEYNSDYTTKSSVPQFSLRFAELRASSYWRFEQHAHGFAWTGEISRIRLVGLHLFPKITTDRCD
jgi:hypothetical protein